MGTDGPVSTATVELGATRGLASEPPPRGRWALQDTFMSSFDQLVSTVVRAKDGDALAPVTVVVPNHACGRDVLHYLARTEAVANISILTSRQAMTSLVAPVLAPRQPLPYPLLEASVQRVLAEQPGVFADVADEPITADALSAAAWRLTAHPGPESQNPTPLVADMLRVYRTALTPQLTSRYYLPHEAAAIAAHHVERLGIVVLFALSDDAPGDKPFLDALREIAQTIEVPDSAAPTQFIHTSDADDEIRAVVRLVRKHLAAGIPGHRIGIFYATDDPYLGLLHEHLADARIEFTGPDHHTLIDRPAGRSLLGLLNLDPAVLPRRDLFAILAERAIERPIRDDQPISLSRLERLTRTAEPIVGGTDWDRLTQVDAEHRNHDVATALHRYITELRTQLTAIESAETWADVADDLTGLLDNYFRTSRSETAAADLAAIRADCLSLTHMDGIAPPPTRELILDAITVRLEAHRGRHGTSGVGVSIGPLTSGVGRDLDVSIIVGAAEGILPAARRDDPLLPAELIGRTLADDMSAQHRTYVAALGAGSADRIVTFPRGSLRGGAEKVPSRWLLPALANLAGEPVNVVDWQQQTQSVQEIVAVESFDVATQTGDPRIGTSAASATEWRLRELAGVPANRRQHVLDDPVIHTGMRMRSDRLNGRFTQFNGNVAAVAHFLTVFDQPVSPTGLETWVRSPYKFFLQHVLGVKPLDDPDEAAQIDALTRGTLIHNILERYVRGSIAGEPLDHARLWTVATEILDRAEEDSPGWLAQLWDKDRGTIMRDLSTWFDRDSTDHDSGWQPHDVELAFGDDHLVQLNLGDKTIRFRGSIDRIDRHTDGRLRVTDYKTGKGDKYKALTADNPTDEGMRFQLPVYTLLALTLGADVSARYWFITSAGGFKDVGYDVTPSVLDVLTADMTLVYSSIAAGYFPPRPPDERWPEPVLDLIGRPALERAWANLENVPELGAYLAKYGG